jgi:spermidine synthase
MARLIILLLFFLSGLAALIYQVTWVRQSTLVFGVSVYAYSAVLTAFMGGSALGSYWIGRQADRTGSPLRLYALLQLGIGVLAFVTPFALTALLPLYARLAQLLPANALLLNLVRLVMALLVLAPATLLMGATLPVIARAYAKLAGRVGSDIGQLYAADTLGAALGCALAGLFFIRLFGTRETVWIGVALNLTVAAGAWWLARAIGEGESAQDKSRERIKSTKQTNDHSPFTINHSQFTIPLLYALSGFTALAYEVVWSRILAIFTLNAVFSFSIMLTTFLFGLAFGGWIGAAWVRRRRIGLVEFGAVQLGLAFSALLTLYVFWLLPNRVTVETVFGPYSVGNLILYEFLLGFLTFLIPATLFGLLFPLVVSLFTHEQTTELGRRIGLLNALNTAGAVVGSLAAGFLLLPWLGLQKTTLLLALVNLLLGGFAYWVGRPANGIRWRVPAAAGALFVVLALLLPPGYYLGFRADPPDNMIFYDEGVETTVAVFEVPAENFKVSFVNGRIEVPTDPISMKAFRLLGHLPAMLKPDAQRALMLSFGNGVASGSLDSHRIPHIDAVDLSAEQFAAAELYWRENYNVLRSASLHTHVEDGRNFLLQVGEPYDIITTDATHPVNTSSWALFTQEFYQSVAARLTPDGIFVQWLPFHNLREEDYKTILRTIQSVFPNATLWYTGGSHTTVLATMTPLSDERLAVAFAAASTNLTVLDDLGAPENWPGYLAMDRDELRAYTGEGALTTDNDAFFLPYDIDNMRILQTMEGAVR